MLNIPVFQIRTPAAFETALLKVLTLSSWPATVRDHVVYTTLPPPLHPLVRVCAVMMTLSPPDAQEMDTIQQRIAASGPARPHAGRLVTSDDIAAALDAGGELVINMPPPIVDRDPGDEDDASFRQAEHIPPSTQNIPRDRDAADTWPNWRPNRDIG